MNHQINIDEAIAIAKEYHLETIVTKQKASAVKTSIFSFNLIVVGRYTLNLQTL